MFLVKNIVETMKKIKRSKSQKTLDKLTNELEIYKLYLNSSVTDERQFTFLTEKLYEIYKKIERLLRKYPELSTKQNQNRNHYLNLKRNQLQ